MNAPQPKAGSAEGCNAMRSSTLVDAMVPIQTSRARIWCTVNPENFVRNKFSGVGDLWPFVYMIFSYRRWPLRILWLAARSLSEFEDCSENQFYGSFLSEKFIALKMFWNGRYGIILYSMWKNDYFYWKYVENKSPRTLALIGLRRNLYKMMLLCYVGGGGGRSPPSLPGGIKLKLLLAMPPAPFCIRRLIKGAVSRFFSAFLRFFGPAKKKLIPKTIGNRKKDCAWGCARGINTTWENLRIEKHKSGRRSFGSPDWFLLFDLRIFSGGVYPPSATSRTISFSISNSYWY